MMSNASSSHFCSSTHHIQCDEGMFGSTHETYVCKYYLQIVHQNNIHILLIGATLYVPHFQVQIDSLYAHLNDGGIMFHSDCFCTELNSSADMFSESCFVFILDNSFFVSTFEVFFTLLGMFVSTSAI